jgi:hypothetical protein
MARSSFGDLYADFVVKHPQKSARTLADLRRRVDELDAGAAPRSPSETPESVRHQIERYLAGFRAAARCEDCGKALDDPVSVKRGIGPDCHARRQRRTRPELDGGDF